VRGRVWGAEGGASAHGRRVGSRDRNQKLIDRLINHRHSGRLAKGLCWITCL